MVFIRRGGFSRQIQSVTNNWELLACVWGFMLWVVRFFGGVACAQAQSFLDNHKACAQPRIFFSWAKSLCSDWKLLREQKACAKTQNFFVMSKRLLVRLNHFKYKKKGLYSGSGKYFMLVHKWHIWNISGIYLSLI